MYWILIIALCSAYCLLAIKRFIYWEKKGVKHKFSLPPLGDNLEFIVKGLPLFEMIMTTYNRFPKERYLGLYVFNQPILMIRDPQLIKQMCLKDYEFFLDHRDLLPEGNDVLWNKNLVALKGHKWKNMRSTLNPSFTSAKMRKMFDHMYRTAENFVNHFSQGTKELQEVELKDAFSRYTNDVIATNVFGVECDSLRDRENEFFMHGKQANSFSSVRKNVKLMLTMMMPFLSKVLNTTFFEENFTKFIKKIVGETLEYREKNNVEKADMINLLMNARKGNQHTDNSRKRAESSSIGAEIISEVEIPHKVKIELTQDDITSQALLFFYGGFETVSSTMCFIAYELATNPDIQQRLMKELDEFRSTQNTVTYEALSELSYLDMVFSETLRRWPPIIATDRSCVKPYTINSENLDEKPVHLTDEDTISIPIWAIHHDPKYWENPEKFDPERFSSENKAKIIPFTYMPFGLGPRICIGYRYATAAVKMMFYALLADFEIVPTAKSSIPLVPSKLGFTLAAANGFWFGLKKRGSTMN